MKKLLKDKKKLFILLLAFVIGGIAGFIYEEIFYRIDLGYFVKRGTTFGPWIPIYGFGSVFIIIGTEKLKKSPLKVFLAGVLITGILEFATGFTLHKLFNMRLWDYNTEIWNWGNIGGYICARSVLLFGFAALFLQYKVVPMLEKFYKKIPKEKRKLYALIPSILFALDIIINLILTAITIL